MGGILSALGGGTNNADFNAQQAQTQQGNYAPAIAQGQQAFTQGQDQLGAVQGQQNNYLQTLLSQVNGGGPNLAQQQLQNGTQASAAQTAGAIASQRGINPGTGAREIANAGAQINQQAAGQSAEARLQQQLGTQSLYGQQLGQAQAGGLGQEAAGAGLFGQGAGAQNTQNNTAVANQAQANNANEGIAAVNAQDNNKNLAGAANALGQVGAALEIPGMTGFSHGGAVPPAPRSAMASLSRILGMARGGKVPVRLSPNEIAVPPSVAQNPDALRSYLLSGGGAVPGRAPVAGDSPKNDIVGAEVEPGTVVVPRSKVADGEGAAEAFVAAVEARKRKKGAKS